MKIIDRLFFCFIFVLAISLYVFAEEKTGVKKICILYSPSKYKEELEKKIEGALSETGAIIKKDTFKNIKKYNPRDYDIVILLSGIAAFIPYPQATKYIKKNDYFSNIIYFCATYLEEDAAYGFLDKNKIDAITAASEEDNIDDTVEKILDAVYKIIPEIKE